MYVEGMTDLDKILSESRARARREKEKIAKLSATDRMVYAEEKKRQDKELGDFVAALMPRIPRL